jgi:hypothetical protein
MKSKNYSASDHPRTCKLAACEQDFLRGHVSHQIHIQSIGEDFDGELQHHWWYLNGKHSCCELCLDRVSLSAVDA